MLHHPLNLGPFDALGCIEARSLPHRFGLDPGQQLGRLGRVLGQRHKLGIIAEFVPVAAFTNAAQTFVQQRFDDSLREVYSWLLGGLSTDGWSEVLVVLPYVALASAVILVHRRVLDVMAVGDVEAASLGVDPARSRLVLVLAASVEALAPFVYSIF